MAEEDLSYDAMSESLVDHKTAGKSKSGAPPTLTPTSYFGFKAAMTNYCLAKHGAIGQILSIDAYPTVLDVDLPDALDGVLQKNYTLEQEGLKAVYMEELKVMVSERARIKAQKIHMFGTLMGSIGIESEQKLEEDTAEWEAIKEACDPLKLWLAIKKTHLVQATGLKSDDRKLVRNEYNSLTQRPTTTLAEHSQAFSNSAKKLAEVGVELSQEDLAADFLESLDNSRYGMLKATVRRNALQGIKAAPATLREAVTLAVGWRAMMPPQSAVSVQGSASTTQGPESGVVRDVTPTSIYVARAKQIGQTKGPLCFLCGADHRVIDCDRMAEAAEYIAGKDKRAALNKTVMFSFAGCEDPDTVVF